jgi:hypothetical protein
MGLFAARAVSPFGWLIASTIIVGAMFLANRVVLKAIKNIRSVKAHA